MKSGSGIAPSTTRTTHATRARNGARRSPQLVNDSEVVITFLFDDAAVERVYLGADGLLAGRVEGRLLHRHEHGDTGHARADRAVAGLTRCRLHRVPRERLHTHRTIRERWSASRAAKPRAFARAQPLLAQLCRRVEHVGPLGAGARMKLAANLLLAVFWQALGEVTAPRSMPLPRMRRAPWIFSRIRTSVQRSCARGLPRSSPP